jgi:dihydroorotate dehydrogenase electron transfer subunit
MITISRIAENKRVIKNIFRLSAEFAGNIRPGQFFMIKTLDNSFLLPRPLSVNQVTDNKVTFLYRAEGIGTTKISTMKMGDDLQLLGPLGNGFDMDKLRGRIAVVGGGIGIAPLLYLTECLGKKAEVFLGFKDCVYTVDEFENYSDRVLIVTEDGSSGEKGYVTDYIDYRSYDAVVACGPEIMLNKIVKDCKENNIKCYVSLERRMACGIGVCLGCTVMTNYGSRRVCKDGPVFSGEELFGR